MTLARTLLRDAVRRLAATRPPSPFHGPPHPPGTGWERAFEGDPIWDDIAPGWEFTFTPDPLGLAWKRRICE